jgi:putative nucleotidyltransferase with HDIG domain
LTLLLFGIFAEQQAVAVKVGRAGGNSSISFLPLLTILLLFGPTAAVGSVVINMAVVEYVVRRKSTLRASFNLGQMVISTAVAGWAFVAAGGIPLMTFSESARATNLLEQLGPFALFAVVFLVMNHSAVALALALSQGLPFRKAWNEMVGPSSVNLLYDLSIGPIAVAVAALYIEVGIAGLFLTIFPFVFIRHSYLTTQQLQAANADLLKALVKAIETRDPYTSGHSLRVQRLAKSIAQAMGVPGKRAEAIESAALLHDIGKIEGVYSDILKKPAGLSKEERAVIESHVTKGAELLGSLTSLGDPVILAVKHHHEHFDGSGYPEGLAGADIPQGARIIKVCDAIDAMLSDRPYRKALGVDQVHEQLGLYSGIQFDPEIVDCVVSHDLIRLHHEELSSERRRGESNIPLPTSVAAALRLVGNA